MVLTLVIILQRCNENTATLSFLIDQSKANALQSKLSDGPESHL